MTRNSRSKVLVRSRKDRRSCSRDDQVTPAKQSDGHSRSFTSRIRVLCLPLKIITTTAQRAHEPATPGESPGPYRAHLPTLPKAGRTRVPREPPGNRAGTGRGDGPIPASSPRTPGTPTPAPEVAATSKCKGDKQ